MMLVKNNTLFLKFLFVLILKEEVAKKILFQFQCVTWKLEKALGNLPYERLDISEEVQEQVGIGYNWKVHHNLAFPNSEHII